MNIPDVHDWTHSHAGRRFTALRDAGAWLLASLAASLAAALLGAAPAQALVTGFDTGLEGWRVTGDNASAWQPTGGNPGGCLSVNDLATGDYNYVVAPPVFLGDWRAMTATDSLMVDIYFQNTSGGALVPPPWLFRLAGPGGAATTMAGVIPPQSAWNRLGTSLDPAQWTLERGTWEDLLQNVDTVLILGEYVTGAEVVRMDNVRVTGPVSHVLAPCVTETFNGTGLEDWSFQNTGGTSNPGSGGNTGGFCQVADASNLSYAFAPSRFLGDWSPLDGAGRLTVDIRIVSGTGPLLSVPEFIRLSGPGGVAVVPMATAELPPAGRLWKTFTYPLQAATWTMVSGTWAGLLANVTECRLQAEFINGTEQVGFDNFGRFAAECGPADQAVSVRVAGVSACGFTGFTGLSTVALNPLDGHLYGTVDAASGAGGGLYAVTGPSAGVRVQAYETPAHVIFDANGSGFITEDASGNVYRRTAAGVSSLWVAGFHSGDDDPFGMCFAPAGFTGPDVAPGDILVTDWGYLGPDEVWAFSAAAAENERQVLVDPGEVDYYDIAAGPAGTVYLADALATGSLSILSPAGALTALPLSEPVTGIVSLAWDGATNRIYILEQGTQTLRRVEAGTGAVELVADGFSAVATCGLEIDVTGRRLWAVDGGAGRVYEFCLGSASAVGDDPGLPGADGAALGLLSAPRVWPNPLQAGATFSFALGREAEARLEIYDLGGRLVRRLLAEQLPAGERTVAWDGRDANGRSVAAGLYLARLSAAGQVRTARVAVVR